MAVKKRKKRRGRKQQIIDILNAAKSKNREDEIAEHGKPLRITNVVESKKRYKRHNKHRKYEYE